MGCGGVFFGRISLLGEIADPVGGGGGWLLRFGIVVQLREQGHFRRCPEQPGLDPGG